MGPSSNSSIYKATSEPNAQRTLQKRKQKNCKKPEEWDVHCETAPTINAREALAMKSQQRDCLNKTYLGKDCTSKQVNMEWGKSMGVPTLVKERHATEEFREWQETVFPVKFPPIGWPIPRGQIRYTHI